MNNHPASLHIGNSLDVAVAAAKTDLPVGTSIAVSGTTYTVPDLIAKLESLQSAFSGVRDAKSALHELIVQRNAVRPEAIAFLASLKAAVTNIFGSESPEIEKFGFKPKKARAPLTAEQALARAAKAKATRAKRGTLGRKQKEAVKYAGTPVVSVTLPAEADSSPASSASVPGASAGVSGGSSMPSPSSSPVVPVAGAASPLPAPPAAAK